MSQGKKKKGGFMSGLSSFGKAALDKAGSAMKDVKNFVTNPKHSFHEGNILGLISASCDKSLMVSPAGYLTSGNQQKQYRTDRFCQFEVMSGGSLHPSSVKLRCVANKLYLRLYSGSFATSCDGGPECDFLVHAVNDEHGSPRWVCLESAVAPGYHLGLLPTGQLSSPPHTCIDSPAAHFSVECISKKEYAPEYGHCTQAPPPSCDSAHFSISCGAPDVHCNSISSSHSVHMNVHGSSETFSIIEDSCGNASVTLACPAVPVVVANPVPQAVVVANPPVVLVSNAGPPAAPPPAVATTYPPPAPAGVNPYPPPPLVGGNPYPPPPAAAGNPYPPPPAPAAGNPYPPPVGGNPYPPLPPVGGNPYPPPPAPAAGNPYPPPAAGNPYPPRY